MTKVETAKRDKYMVAIADKAVNHHEEYEPAPGEDDIFLVFTQPCDQLAEVKNLYPNIDFKIVFDN